MKISNVIIKSVFASARLLTLSLLSVAALASLTRDAAADLPLGRHYKRLCPQSSLPQGRSCNSWIVADVNDLPVREAAPPSNSLGASDLETAYHLPKSGGNGKIIASLLGVHYPNAEADLAVYRAQYGLPPCTKANGCFIQIDGNGGTNFPTAGTCNGVAGESSLDIQMLSAGCPDCKIMLVEPNGQGDTQGITQAIKLGAVGMSFSFCGSENGTANEASQWNHPGFGLFASTGDWGYLNHEAMGGVCSPGSFPGVVSVGGTTLTKATNARGWIENVWSHGGSACSTVFAKPAWQTDTGCKMRMLADVSAMAENVANYCTDPGGNGGWGTTGGTSASAPFVAGALAVVGALDGTTFTPKWVYDHASGFFDVTAGTNGPCAGVSSYYCNAVAGYDGPTGLGSPNGDALAGGDGGTPPGGGVIDSGEDARGGRDAGRSVDASGSIDASIDAGRSVDASVDARGTGGATGSTTTGGGGSGGAGGNSGSTSTTTGGGRAGAAGMTGTTGTTGTGTTGSTSAGSTGSAGAGTSSTSTTTGSTVSTGTSGTTTSSGGGADGGCSCRFVGHRTSSSQTWGALLVAGCAAMAGSRRRRR